MRGFRTFHERTIVELCPRTNVVVGLNGSGKSNFFLALEFVLSDKYSNLTASNRREFLHEGASSHVMSCYVEIILDNKCRRFPLNEDSISIKRTLSTTTDEFSINGRHVPAREFRAMLESAGFCRRDPYYIVQQGRVVELSIMSDRERLALFEEVAGAKVFDEQRKEAEIILQRTRSKRSHVESKLVEIDKVVAELGAEYEELNQYRSFSKKKKQLEYLLVDQDLTIANNNCREALKKFQTRALAVDDAITKHTAMQAKAELVKGELARAKDAESVFEAYRKIARKLLKRHLIVVLGLTLHVNRCSLARATGPFSSTAASAS